MSGIKRTRGATKAATKALVAASAVVLTSAALHAAPNAQPLNTAPSVHWFADWDVNQNPAPMDFFPTPFATNTNTAVVKSTLTVSANNNIPLGLKVAVPLTSATATSLFGGTGYGTGHKAISYIFGDFESAGSLNGTPTNVANIKTLAKQVKDSSWTNRAYVGEFALTPLTGIGTGDGQDPSRRGVGAYTEAQYKDAKVNMANTDLYPGSANFRNKSSNDWSNANIRTGLFVAPIMRMSAVQTKLDKSYGASMKVADNLKIDNPSDKQKQIPWVARFNNYGNLKLDTNNSSADGYKFIPGAPLTQDGLSGAQTANQMMGRGDFSAQILQYRMRGAYSVNLFSVPDATTEGGDSGGGVLHYTESMARQDVRDGWYGGSGVGPLAPVAHVNTIFAKSDAKYATMTYNPTVDGTTDPAKKRSEVSGTIWSGVYSMSLGKMDIILSNLDTSNHKVKFSLDENGDNKDGIFITKTTNGFAYDDGTLLNDGRNALIEAGMHRLLQFDLVTTRVYKNAAGTGSFDNKQIWLLNQSYAVFQGNNRNEVGIPEPTTFGMLAAAGSMSVVCRRHRRSKKA